MILINIYSIGSLKIISKLIYYKLLDEIIKIIYK